MKRNRALYASGLALGVLPLWVGRHLPLVDLPQHLHLISVLHRLHDPSTLYPRLFEARHALTPYLGYYYLVSALHWLLPLELANRVFLTGYVIGYPLAMGFFLRSLGRPRWPALLALPFAYGDALGWGFINFCASLPLAVCCLGLFTRALTDAPLRTHWATLHALGLVLTLLFHVQAFAFLGLALPLLLWMTPVAGGLRPRAPALLSVLPALLLFLVWVGGRLGQPTQVETGAPWKAWGPLLSQQNLAFLSFHENLTRLFPSLGNLLRDESDAYGVLAATIVAALALGGWFALPRVRGAWREGRWAQARLPLLALAALALYFLLPFDIRGYLYYLNPRYAHLFAPLALAAVPPLARSVRPFFLAGATAAVALTSFALVRGFVRFQDEARPLDALVERTGPRPVVMGLLYDVNSRICTHPVFLHSAAELARAQGGTSHFSFALQPHIPVGYRVAPPRAPPSEWRPDQFDFRRMGPDYDHFLVRGVPPGQVLGMPLATGELVLVAEQNGWYLLRRPAR